MDLERCPFCGGGATAIVQGLDPDRYTVGCFNYASCEINPKTFNYLFKADAIKAWNTRAEPKCEHSFSYITGDICLKCGEVYSEEKTD